MQRCWNTLYLHLSDFLFYVFIKIKKTRETQFHAFLRFANVFVADRLFRLYFPFVNSPENGGILAVLIICLQPPLMEDSFAFAQKTFGGLEWKALRFGKLEIRLPFTFDEFASKRRVPLKVNSCQWLQWKTSFWFLIIIYFYSFPQFSFRFWYFYFSFNKRSWEKTTVSRFVFT